MNDELKSILSFIHRSSFITHRFFSSFILDLGEVA